ncbi:MAG: FHA domain-containing protein [Myxococcota bacterium]
MNQRAAILTIERGPNQGDTVRVEIGTCRLIGRHLSESETAFMDRDGNRVLDNESSEILHDHLKDLAPATTSSAAEKISAKAFDRGADIVLADDSISRAHAMIFFDPSGVGVVDLASTNGTYVNSDRVISAVIKDGDSLTIGGSGFRLKVR